MTYTIQNAYVVTAALFSAMLLMAQPAYAGPQSGSFRLRATVPLSCWVRPETAMQAVTGAEGSVTEACNNPGGFTVTANYRPLRGDESASLTYGTSVLDLAEASGKIVSQSNRAAIRKMSYRFDAVKVDTPLIVVLTIRPI
ncbi:hypothetical protein PFY01_01110 [Brevundimonas vesicularis]|uniref:hypothetical protein n=1 Tax=Brevundimonas vesicularis TaxID=41276 RepID=UPI0022EC65BD|nr:hypothetical protein [Brevundimonas vesicularis]WBT06313.1 hypothetical protein PFY01_01110 [Brevundimonas vesicularis]